MAPLQMQDTIGKTINAGSFSHNLFIMFYNLILTGERLHSAFKETICITICWT